MTQIDAAEWIINRILKLLNRQAARSATQRRMDTDAMAMTFCVAKAKYKCRADADKVLARTCSRTKSNSRAAITPYRCPVCGKWHIGSTLGGRKSMRKGKHNG